MSRMQNYSVLLPADSIKYILFNYLENRTIWMKKCVGYKIWPSFLHTTSVQNDLCSDKYFTSYMHVMNEMHAVTQFGLHIMCLLLFPNVNQNWHVLTNFNKPPPKQISWKFIEKFLTFYMLTDGWANMVKLVKCISATCHGEDTQQNTAISTLFF